MGREGICGICDDFKTCFSVGFWNKKDKMVKNVSLAYQRTGKSWRRCERIFLLSGFHPTHSYMKMLYKYPQNAFPYEDLIKTNAERSKTNRNTN
jgi:hypothetical protein